ncbi:MAG: TatD family hydrolase [Candidatus Eremiobacteraeota bacterium]|nr:TatD family hydrolase [Candidatus Eremiobacteraeota bacterium]
MKASMVDVHAHLSSAEFDSDRNDVLERAKRAGVRAILSAGEDYRDNLKILELASQFPMIRPCLGHYPALLGIDEARRSLDLIGRHRGDIAAISEVGLDYRMVDDPGARELQREIFSLFIAAAREYALPLIVHSRSAGHHAIEFLLEHRAARVCLHAFDGRASYAERGAREGFYFSIPPSVAHSAQKQKLVKALPLEVLLLESDSPVLGPRREERNEPANVALSAAMIAQIKGIGLQEVLAELEKNTGRFLASES